MVFANSHSETRPKFEKVKCIHSGRHDSRPEHPSVSLCILLNAMLTRTLEAVRIKPRGAVFRKNDENSYRDNPLILLSAGVVELGRHKGLKIRNKGDWQLIEKQANPLIYLR